MQIFCCKFVDVQSRDVMGNKNIVFCFSITASLILLQGIFVHQLKKLLINILKILQLGPRSNSVGVNSFYYP